MASTKFQNAANLATVFAAIVATFTFIYGYRQFSETQKATRETLSLQKDTLEEGREAQAVELFIKYNELMKEPPSKSRSGKDTAEFWRNNIALSIAESIYKLRNENEGWVKTVEWMLSHHTEFLKKDRVDCGTFDDKFMEFVKQLVGPDICMPMKLRS